MPILLFLSLPILELSLWIYAGNHYGWMNLLGWELISFFLGMYLIKQQSITRQPDFKAMVGGFLLLTPGLITDFIGLTFVLPGVNLIWSLLFKTQLERVIHSGAVKGFAYKWSPQSQADSQSPTAGVMDDGNLVIDAEFVELPVTEKKSE